MFLNRSGIVGTPVPSGRAGRLGATAPTPAVPAPPTVTQALISGGALSASDLALALGDQARDGGAIEDILRLRGMVDEPTLVRAQAQQFATSCVSAPVPGGAPALVLDAPGPDPALPDPRLIDRLGVARCLRLRCLPWTQAGNVCVVATSRPQDFAALRPGLERRLGPVVMALIGDSALDTAVARARRDPLRHRAETWVRATESCRDWSARGVHRWLAALLLGLVAAGIAAPVATLWALTALALLAMVACNAFKAGAIFHAVRQISRRPAAANAVPTVDQASRAPEQLPMISILVPVFREPDTVPRLINRLSRLHYPRSLLDLILVVEENDAATLAALASTSLPRWMRVIAVPDSPLRTKPRALNYAMAFARGSIIGVYDAEDAPDPDQLLRVARCFAGSGPDLACVQGMLDYFNPTTNWLSRCFTVEYASWYRLILPGNQSMGLVLPLGGTTLFFRRSALEHLRGWDAHNVTEDADLGIRLARHGFRTEILDTTTFEEANCHVLPWVRQRSRWLKGYAITYAVHMRNPRRLLQQLGPWRFAGLQVQFLGSLVQVLLAPLLLSFWAVPLGLWHPLAGTAPLWVAWSMAAVFFLAMTVDLVAAFCALHNPHHRWLRRWIVLIPLYFPLASVAAFKAMWELATAPHYWDKTAHGAYGTSLDRATVISA